MHAILFVIVQAFANLIQAISGFAGGPLAMPPSMQLVGVNTAKCVITFIFFISTTVLTVQYRTYINKKQVVKMTLIMLIGFLPGMWLFDKLPTTIIMIVYAILVIFIGIWKYVKPASVGLNGPLGYIALIVAGAMQGMFTSGGPFAVIYASSALKDKNEFRASLSAVWAMLNLYMTIRMYQGGLFTPEAIRLSAYSIVPVFLAIFAGNRISQLLNQKTFHKIVCVLLIISGSLLLINTL